MKPSRSHLPRGPRMGLSLAVVTALGLALSGCSGSTTTAESSGNASGTTGSASASQLQSLTEAAATYPLPSGEVKDVSAVKGKVIYYIPISLQAPQFAATQKSITAAANAVGADVQVCDGKGTPSAVSSCVEQATSAKAAGIVADAVPYGMGGNSFDAAQKAGIPVVIGNQLDDPDHPAGADLAFVNSPGTTMMNDLNAWIAQDSGQKATILVNQTADSAAAKQYVADSTEKLKSTCQDCTVVTNDVSSANFSQVPSSTSSALLKNPSIGYVVSQFDQFLQPTTSGIQQSGKTSSVKVVAGAAQVSTLKQLASGNGVQAAVGQAGAYQAWVFVDAILRMHAKQDVPEYEIPVRLFTQDSVKDIDVSADAEASGEWFGPTTFTADFKKLWGVS